MEENETKLRKVSRRVEKMLRKVMEYGGDTRKSVRGRLKDLQAAFDEDSE
jgi:hypothetical protein